MAYDSLVRIIEAVKWTPDGKGVRIVDQRELPGRFVERDLYTLDELAQAIRTLAVRGAPAIGVAAALGLAALARAWHNLPREVALARITETGATLRATRPTAVNLPWAVERMLSRARCTAGDGFVLAGALRAEADAILAEDRAMCRHIGEHGASLIPDGARVLTHCNAGALATAGIGTALAAIYVAVEQGRRVEVLVDETRPLLQGSRLTAWELTQAGIPATVLADNMAAALMRAGKVDLCIVGADRIARNGDVANKTGTYGVAVAAHHHDIPFYVAAPTSTIDSATATGDEIVIEQRDAAELREAAGRLMMPGEARVHNPAFDVTPHELVTAIVTDVGIHRPPFHFAGD